MKSVDPLPRPLDDEWSNPQVTETLPPSSTRGAALSSSCPSLSEVSLPDNDRTRIFLHQLSQTLTALRGTLELALLVDSDAQDYRRAIQQSLVHAEGLVQLFKSYRATGQGGNSRPRK